jgi:LacI family transcriptional regulator
MVDVARVAGVGTKTVSRFVNGETNIDPALVERIREAISGLGYRRNLAAASIRPGWTARTLGLVIGDLANPYYSAVARAIEGSATERGYMLTTVSSDEDGERHDRFIDRLMEQRIDGLIVVPPRHPARPWSEVIPPIPPIVFIDRPGDLAVADVVLADNTGGARIATRTLADVGARRIAFVGDSPEIYTIRERLAGYADALTAVGLRYDEALVVTGAHSAEDAARAVSRLLRDDVADAVFASNNRASIGAVLAFKAVGRRVPLIGFDDFEAAQLTEPAVSVVSHDIAIMGRTAAELVLDRIAGDDAPPATRILPTRLELRGSERP